MQKELIRAGTPGAQALVWECLAGVLRNVFSPGFGPADPWGPSRAS